jgi:CelD/BcsL family acetyltransferase involved in cellulose biosynthesis
VKAKVLESVRDLRALEAAWRRLGASCTPSSTFQLADWVLPWWEAFGGRYELRVLAIYDGERLAGVLPLMLSGDGELTFVGTPLNDRNGMLARPADLGPAWRVALETLADVDGWASFKFGPAPEGDLRACTRGKTLDVQVLPAGVSPVLDLASMRKPYLELVPKQRRQRWLRALRRLSLAHDVRFACLTGAEVTESELLAFDRRFVAHWRNDGRFDTLCDEERHPAYGSFLAKAGTALAAVGHVALTHLLVDRRPIASGLFFRWGSTVLDYKSTFERAFARFSPGVLCTLHGIEHFRSSGVALYDFGRGNEDYKFQFLAVPRELRKLNITRLRNDIEAVVPAGATCVLIGKGHTLSVGGGRRLLPFPERGGDWAGYPVDDADAIAELERLQTSGANYVIVPAPMFYWLDAYPGLAAHLRVSGQVRTETAGALIVELPRATSSGASAEKASGR